MQSSYAKAVKIYRNIKKIVKPCIPKASKMFLAGSVAKKTSIDYLELDIYIQLNMQYDCIEKIAPVLNACDIKYTIHTAISKYFTLQYRGYHIDLVPIMPTPSNSMYHSLKHVAYIKKHLTQPNEVIKLKKWCIENHLYHSSVDSGVSGYICELVIIKFNLFTNLFIEPFSVFTYLKTICDPVNPTRELYAGFSTAILHKFYYCLTKICNKNVIEGFLQYGLKVAKLEHNKQNMCNVKYFYKKLKYYHRFFEYVITKKWLYLAYFQSIHYVLDTTELTPQVNLANASYTNYLSFKSKKPLLNRMILIDLTQLNYKLILNANERYRIIPLFKYEYYSNQTTIRFDEGPK